MCADKKPNPKDFLNNLRGPGAASEKLRSLLKNNLIKITGLRSCCGHPGEPGC